MPAPDNLRDADGVPLLVLPEGTRLHGYELRFLAVGGMSVVYLARRGSAQYLIKEVPQRETRAVQALEHEAQLLKRLNHPGIVKAFEIFRNEDQTYLVREYIPGTSLDKQISPFPGIYLAEATVRSWGIQLCDLFAYLHGQQPPLIYRDLKPKNVILDPQGRLHLIDFGITRSFKEGQKQDTELLGSALTASPEHYGGQTDIRSDLFTLGATLHYLLTNGQGERTSPFDFPPVRSVNRDVSEEMERLLARCLQRDPALRFQSAAELRQALTGETPEPAALPAPVLVAQRNVPSVPWQRLQPIFLVLAGVALGLVLNRARQPQSATSPSLSPSPSSPQPRSSESIAPVFRSEKTTTTLSVANIPSPSATPLQPVPSTTSTTSRSFSSPPPLPPPPPAPVPSRSASPSPPPVIHHPSLGEPQVPLASPHADASTTSSGRDGMIPLAGLGFPLSGLETLRGRNRGSWRQVSSVRAPGGVFSFPVPPGWFVLQDDPTQVILSPTPGGRAFRVVRLRISSDTGAAEELASRRLADLARWNGGSVEKAPPIRIGGREAAVLLVSFERLPLNEEEVLLPCDGYTAIFSGAGGQRPFPTFRRIFEGHLQSWGGP